MGRIESEQAPVLEAAINTFMQLLPRMLKNHKGEWVVFKDGEKEPLGFSKSQEEIFNRAVGKYGNTSFLLRQVTQEYIKFGKYGRPLLITRNLGV